jgi:tetratricopeptide (TPR) repeat protein
MTSEATSSIELEVSRIRELSKARRHREALVAAEALAVAVPENRDALYLIAANQRCLNRIADALATLQHLEQQHPRFSLLYQERGHCHVTLQDIPRAIDAFLQAVNLNPALVASWTMLERLYRTIGETQQAAAAAEQVSTLNHLPPEIVRAGSLFSDGDLSAAEQILRVYLLDGRTHVEASRLLARIEHQFNALDDAELRLEAALKVAPNYRAAKLDYIRVLLDQQKYLKALELIDTLLRSETGNQDYLSLEAAACVGLGQHETAIELYRELLAESPSRFDLHVALGHSLQSVGRQNEAIACYQKAAALQTWLR